MKKLIVATVVALLLATGAGAANVSNVTDPGDGGGTYPYYTGYCQFDGAYDNDPNSYGPDTIAYLGTRRLKCAHDGSFFYDTSGDGFYMD